ncbi:MAG: tetratricopeptide repeat protein [Myxococcales bacterium]|nr:tetratricopeptide repeat protein [Myxococcales bacterium]
MNPRSLTRALCGAALVVGLTLGLGGCDGTLKYVRFPVQEGNSRIYYEKFFNDGMGIDADQAAAYNAIERGQNDVAVQICEGAVGSHPNDVWAHYNLAILYEMKGNWDGAERHINEAIRLQQLPNSKGQKGDVNTDFYAELGFIKSHKK